MDHSRIAGRLRDKITQFSGELSKGLPKVARRLVSEIVYGVQASQSVMLTDIARTLHEPISVKKTEERLSRRLQTKGLSVKIGDRLLEMAADRVDSEALIIFDPSDLRKRYGKKMQYLCNVHDGSSGEIGIGYWLLNIVAAWRGRDEIVPLYNDLYSTTRPDFVGENQEWKRAIGQVSRGIACRGLWVVDRGGDRESLLKLFLDKRLRFVIRQRGDRKLLFGKRLLPTSEIARQCPKMYSDTLIRQKNGKDLIRRIFFGFRRVRLPNQANEPLYLVVVFGLGNQPLMLLTSEPMRKNRNALWQIIESYFRRWAIEETIRFQKQSYGLENIRVLTYESLRNLVALTGAASFFAACILDTEAKLKVLASHTIKAAKRLFGVPDFRYYAIADGLQAIFKRAPGRIIPKPISPSPQFLLSFHHPPP